MPMEVTNKWYGTDTDTINFADFIEKNISL